LLNAVAHRLGGLPVEDGEVAYFASTDEADRVKLEKGEVKRRLGFVRQQDFLVECLTGESSQYFLDQTGYQADLAVRETLTYASHDIRYPRSGR
jgi:hypothetical protein